MILHDIRAEQHKCSCDGSKYKLSFLTSDVWPIQLSSLKPSLWHKHTDYLVTVSSSVPFGLSGQRE